MMLNMTETDYEFLSTPSVRRATNPDGLEFRGVHFYPRPPRGGRHD